MINPNSANLQQRATHTVSVTIKIDGKDVTANPGGFISASIYRELNKIPTARLFFADGVVEQQDFPKSNTNDFSPGKEVEILAGYSQQEETIFKGIIVRHAVQARTGRPSVLELECKDPAIKMALVRKSTYHYNQSDDGILRQIVQGYSDLRVGSIQSTPVQHPELVQFHCTDWDFMLLRADANGLAVNVLDAQVNLKKPEVAAQAQLQVQFGQGSAGVSLLEFEADIDTRMHYPGVKAYNWDYTQQPPQSGGQDARLAAESAGNTGAAGASGLGAAMPGTAQRDFPQLLYGQNPLTLFHGGDLDTQELKAWAEAKFKRSELSRVRGRVRVLGLEAIPGDTIELNGVGDRFKGKHLISGVMHQMHNGTWETDIQFGWQATSVAENLDVQVPDAAGLTAAIQGLQIGIVSRLGGDAEAGNHRVQVRLPYIANNTTGTQADGIWARLATLHAGNARGFVFRPDVGDEVIVGFINNDPNDAIVLGALHSNNNAAPSAFPANDDNFKKGFVSKTGLTLSFDDDSNAKLISLNTGSSGPKIELDAKNNKITISLDTNNFIEMTTQGVKIKGTRIDLN
jgi:Rhs element Vgr protein